MRQQAVVADTLDELLERAGLICLAEPPLEAADLPAGHRQAVRRGGGTPVRTRRSEVPSATTGSVALYSRRRWIALVVLLAAGFMDLLDTTIVNVAIPSIRAGLNADYADIQWVVAGYLLAVAVGLITFGRLGDIVGRKRVFLGGVVGFGAMSLCCGIAQSPTVLVGSRVLQGVCAAAMIPQILATIQVSFPREEQRKALALYSTMAGVAVMAGPLLAGVLLSVFRLSWRSIFLINVPVSIVVVVATIVIVPESRSHRGQRPDYGGAALVSAGLFALVFGLIQGRELGWPAWVVALMLGSPVLFGLFAVYERRKERRGEPPLVPLGMFKQRAFSTGLLVVLVLFSGVVGFFLAFTIFLQLGLGYTPLEAALTTLPSSLALVIVSLISTKLAPRPGRLVLATGALLMATAMAGLIIILNRYGGDATAWEFRPVIMLFGLGMGLTVPSLADVVIASVHERDAGAASGLINSGLQVGNAIGVAIIGVILFSVLGSQAANSAQAQTSYLSTQLTSLGVPGDIQQRVLQGFGTCFVDTAHERDPAARPASCRDAAAQLPPAQRQQVSRILTTASDRARKANFAEAIEHALFYGMGAFGASFLLLFLLPGKRTVVARHRAYAPRHLRTG